MARIDDLLARITDHALRSDIEASLVDLKNPQRFGLVFEERIPELAALLGLPIEIGCKVQRRNEPTTSATYKVTELAADGQAILESENGAPPQCVPVDELQVVRSLGEPVYPGLASLGRVRRGTQCDPSHTIISGENYHALQLLLYLVEDTVDCVYIDPPYNTGARDWKYNNHYVDKNDLWRHSKWLAFMKRRLLLAMHLLKPDGIMCITIDDHEVHHLKALIEGYIPQAVILGTVVIKNNPAGRSTVRGFAVAHEYAVFVAKSERAQIGRLERTPEQQARYRERDEDGWFEWVNFRKHGGADANRRARPRMYYPIYAAGTKLRVPLMRWDEPNKSWEVLDAPADDEITILPVNDLGIEKRWKWAHESLLANISNFTVRLDRAGNPGVYMKSRPPSQGTLPSTWWDKPFYSATDYGTNLLTRIMGSNDAFPYPKSKYAVMDCLKTAGVANNRSALVVDFFAGSGTTLDAVLELNAADGGHRRCILITNNEVSAQEAKGLLSAGLKPGDDGYEAHGIAQSVTFPRAKYLINGRRDDNSALDGAFPTGHIISKEHHRTFHQISFINSLLVPPATWKPDLAALIEGIPQSKIHEDTAFFISSSNARSILFEPIRADDYLEALEDQDQIIEFYLVTQDNALFRQLRSTIEEILGPVVLPVEGKRALSEGYAANLEYFRLNYLDPDDVNMGTQFNAILPALWLAAGGFGERDHVDSATEFSIPATSTYGVLFKESRFRQFKEALENHPNVTHVWLVTDSEEAFAEMAEQLRHLNVSISMLYSHYLRTCRTMWELR